MERVGEPISLVFTFFEKCQGFKKWRKRTTASPSNKHLGIYKSFINAIRFNIYTQNETINQIQIQHTLMTLAIQHCHKYNGWKKVHNFMLEKMLGVPLLNKLPVIHIYDADWSLIQEFYIAHKLSNIASREKTVTAKQAGGQQPGNLQLNLLPTEYYNTKS
jgi:hypothetical protein